jgi:hypothetical protein
MPPGGADPMAGAMPPGGADPMAGAMPPGGADPMAGAMPGQPPSPMGMDPMAGGAPPPPPMAMMGQDGLDAASLQSQINPQFLQQAAQLQSGDVFDAAAVSSLAQSPMVKEMIGQYLPNLEKALDNLARVLLTLWMKETDLKQQVGESSFADLENNLRGTFRNMGDLVLKLSQGGHALRPDGEHADA